MEKPVEIMPKPRMALFQGRDDDEPMARQVIQLGSFSFDAKQNVMKARNIDFIATMPTSIIFHGANLSKEKELCQFKKPLDTRSKLTIGSNFIDVSC
jgi:hypothetical protein